MERTQEFGGAAETHWLPSPGCPPSLIMPRSPWHIPHPGRLLLALWSERLQGPNTPQPLLLQGITWFHTPSPRTGPVLAVKGPSAWNYPEKALWLESALEFHL